jgi:hypothetical protein
VLRGQPLRAVRAGQGDAVAGPQTQCDQRVGEGGAAGVEGAVGDHLVVEAHGDPLGMAFGRLPQEVVERDVRVRQARTRAELHRAGT